MARDGVQRLSKCVVAGFWEEPVFRDQACKCGFALSRLRAVESAGYGSYARPPYRISAAGVRPRMRPHPRKPWMNDRSTLVIGTRGSPLALAQAHEAQARLADALGWEKGQ